MLKLFALLTTQLIAANISCSPVPPPSYELIISKPISLAFGATAATIPATLDP